jgi:hypothetical protein
MTERATVDQLDRELAEHAAQAERALAAAQAHGAMLEVTLADTEARLDATERELAAVRLHFSVLEALPFDLIRFLQQPWFRSVNRGVRFLLRPLRRPGDGR